MPILAKQYGQGLYEYRFTHADPTNASVYSVAATSVIASGVYDFADFTLADVGAFSFAQYLEQSTLGTGLNRFAVEVNVNVPASALTIPWAMQMLYSQDAGATWVIASGSLSNAGLSTRCVGVVQPYGGPLNVAAPLIKLRALALGTGSVTIELAGEFSVKVSV